MNKMDRAKIKTVNLTITAIECGMEKGEPLTFDEIGRVFLAAFDRSTEGKI